MATEMPHALMGEVLESLGLQSTPEGVWVSRGVIETEPKRSLSFSRCELLTTGAGLFAAAHGRLTTTSGDLAHLKVALTEHGSDSLVHEIRVLDHLRDERERFVVPRVLARGCTKSGRAWCLMQHVGSRKARIGPHGTMRAINKIAALHLPTPQFPVPASLALAALPLDEPGVSVHGDLIRSNMIPLSGFGRKRQLALIDWEWATGEGMAGFDACHLVLGGVLTRDSPSHEAVRVRREIALALLRSLNLPKGSIRLNAYLEGMRRFYTLCAIEKGVEPTLQPVVINTALVRSMCKENQCD